MRISFAELYSHIYRHYAGAILGSIHRAIAVQQWFQVSNSNSTDPFNIQPSLEKSLAAFDLFVLHDQPGDLNEVGDDSRIFQYTRH